MRCTDLAVHPKRTSSKKGGSATARQSGQKNHKQRMAASFGLVLRALGYPGSPPGQGSLGQGSEEFRKLVSWLEDTKVRRKKHTNRTPPNPTNKKLVCDSNRRRRSHSLTHSQIRLHRVEDRGALRDHASEAWPQTFEAVSRERGAARQLSFESISPSLPAHKCLL